MAYGLPAFLVLTGFFLSRRDVITHDGLTILLVYIAAIWAWIGPVFIWRYEHITTTKYLAMCRKVLKNRHQLFILREPIKHTVLAKKYGVLIIALWCLVIVGTFINSYEFMKGFGIYGKKDIWWHIQVLGVAIYAFITGIGFLLVIRTFLMIRNFLPCDTNINPYHPDQKGGLGFFGNLLSETSFMFASGALFIPALLKLHMELYADRSMVVLIIIGFYVLVTGLSFVVPIWFIHKKLVKEKCKRLLSLSISLTQMQELFENGGLEKYLKYKIYRDQYLDVTRIITWPFDIQNIMMVIASVALPILLTVLQIYFSGNR